MSLILNNFLQNAIGRIDESPGENQADLEHLDRYLAIVENNKKANFFVPNDALVALDMAGFALGKLMPGKPAAPVSAARLAMALVQPCFQTPLQ